MDQEAKYWTCLVGVASCPLVHPDPEVSSLGGIWGSMEDQQYAVGQGNHLYRKLRVSQAILLSRPATNVAATYPLRDDFQKPPSVDASPGALLLLPLAFEALVPSGNDYRLPHLTLSSRDPVPPQIGRDTA
jgi:hypothetical protein